MGRSGRAARQRRLRSDAGRSARAGHRGRIARPARFDAPSGRVVQSNDCGQCHPRAARDRRTDKPTSVHPALPSLRWIERSRPARGRAMHRPRRENTSTGFLGSSGTHETIVQQPDGFIVVSFVPSGPAFLSATHYDRTGRAVSQSNPMLGAPVMKEAAPGGVLYAGDFNAQDQDFRKPPRHQACFLNQDLSIRWCKDLASKGPVVGLGTDAAGNAIVISNGASGEIRAEWFCAIGGGSNGAFTLLDSFVPGANTWFETAPLLESGVAVRRVDQQNDATGRPYTTSQWLVTV